MRPHTQPSMLALLVPAAAAQASTTDCLQLFRSKLSLLDMDKDGGLRHKELRRLRLSPSKIHQAHESIEEAHDLENCLGLIVAPKTFESLDHDNDGILRGEELEPDPAHKRLTLSGAPDRHITRGADFDDANDVGRDCVRILRKALPVLAWGLKRTPQNRHRTAVRASPAPVSCVLVTAGARRGRRRRTSGARTLARARAQALRASHRHRALCGARHQRRQSAHPR